MGILDFIFPKKCANCKREGSYVCPNCFIFLSFDVSPICIMCSKPAIAGLTHPKCQGQYSLEGQFSAITYNKIAQRLIYNFKYKPYLTDLKKFLGELLYEALIQKEEFNKIISQSQNLVLVPIPLSDSKLRKRGYNQAEVLAKELSKKFHFEVKDCLKRVKETRSQFALNKEERKENIKAAFQFDDRYLIKDKNVFLIDDVMTTGATLKEAGKILKKKGVNKIWVITLAQD